MSLFEEKKSVDKEEFLRAVRNPEHNLPTDSEIFDKEKREKIISELFKERGTQIEPSEINKVIEEIRSGKFKEVLEGFDESQKNILINYIKNL